MVCFGNNRFDSLIKVFKNISFTLFFASLLDKELGKLNDFVFRREICAVGHNLQMYLSRFHQLNTYYGFDLLSLWQNLILYS